MKVRTGLCMFCTVVSFAQGVFVPINPDYYYLIDRYEILHGHFFEGLHTSYKPMLRYHIYRAARQYVKDSTKKLSGADRFNLTYLMHDNWEFAPDSEQTGTTKKAVMKHFFQKTNAWYHFRSSEFQIQVNPVLQVEQNTINKAYPLSLNTRGIEIRGSVGNKIGFYTFLTDNQAFVPDYVQAYMQLDTASRSVAFPGEGFTKVFRPSRRWYSMQNQTGYDFFSARGYIHVPIIKQLSMQFGHDKNFVGNGYRSLFLSDNSSKYLFLRAITQVWRLQYTNLFAELTALNFSGNTINPRKYAAMHHLGINISKNFNLGLFESIIFNRGDSLSPQPGFELNYLNPVIFYREAESYLGSKDKTTVGLEAKLNMFRRFSVYGQFALHEFKLNHLLAQRGWWGNKYVWQLGIKYINVFGLKNLDMQLEHNFVRPFVYMDKSAYTAYTHYSQPLAHPMGANFYELLAIVRYQPLNRLFLQARAFYIVTGRNEPGTNYGGNITYSYTTRTLEEGNYIAQGLRTSLWLGAIHLSYMIFHNFFLDFRYQYREERSALSLQQLHVGTFGIRWNMAQRLHEF